jgi:hypothetical protein
MSKSREGLLQTFLFRSGVIGQQPFVSPPAALFARADSGLTVEVAKGTKRHPALRPFGGGPAYDMVEYLYLEQRTRITLNSIGSFTPPPFG